MENLGELIAWCLWDLWAEYHSKRQNRLAEQYVKPPVMSQQSEGVITSARFGRSRGKTAEATVLSTGRWQPVVPEARRVGAIGW